MIGAPILHPFSEDIKIPKTDRKSALERLIIED
jgi:hypothetical protein